MDPPGPDVTLAPKVLIPNDILSLLVLSLCVARTYMHHRRLSKLTLDDYLILAAEVCAEDICSWDLTLTGSDMLTCRLCPLGCSKRLWLGPSQLLHPPTPQNTRSQTHPRNTIPMECLHQPNPDLNRSLAPAPQ